MSKYPLSFPQGVTVVPNTLLLEVTQGNEAIRMKEQERIIALLSDSCECDGTDDGYNYCIYHKAVDLIKGENK
jgi:hypothetical protein